MDIGTLTGAIAIEDQFSSVLDRVTRAVGAFAEDFVDALGPISIGVGVVTAALTGTVAAVTALASKGSDINDVASTFEHFSGSAENAAESLANLRAGVKETVGDLDLMQAASRMTSAGVKLTADDFGVLGQAAFVLQNRGLGPTKDMLELISSAMVTGRTRALAMKLGVVDTADAAQEYADKLGILKSELTQTQEAEARRQAVLTMLRSAVADAGAQELDFSEKLERVQAQIGNWVEKLESAVASSPRVMAAIDSIIGALDEFTTEGDGIETITALIDKFADAVTTYGPPIISLLSDIAGGIRFIFSTVTTTWEALPDWAKFAAKELALAGVSVYGLQKAVSLLAPQLGVATKDGEDFLAVASNYGTITDASISVGKLAVEMRGVRTALQSGAESFGLMNKIVFEGVAPMATLAGKITFVTTAITSAISVGTALYQVWKLHSENSERAAAAKRQEAIDSQNLAILNDKLGTSFKTVAEASAEWIKRNKEAKPAVDEHAAAIAAQEAKARAHKEAVQSVIDAVRTATQSISAARDAYQRLGNEVLFSKAAQDQFVTTMDNVIEAGGRWTAQEAAFYAAIMRDRQATVAYGEEILKKKDVTVESIETNLALGRSEADLAHQYGVSVATLRSYQTEMKTLRALKQEVEDLELKAAGRGAEAIEAAREREKQAAINSFNGTSVAFDEFMQQIDKKYDLLALTGSKSWQAVQDKSISAMQAELAENERVLVHMEMSGNFTREEIEKQRQKVLDLNDAIHHTGDAYESAADRAAKAQQKTQVEIEDTIAKARELERALGNTITYDLSTKEGVGYYRQLNPGMQIVWSDEDIMNFIARGGNLEQLMKLGVIQNKNVLRGGGGTATPPPPPRGSSVAASGGGGNLTDTVADVVGSAAVTASIAAASAKLASPVTHNNTFHVNGTAQETASAIAEIFVKRLGLSTPLPTRTLRG